MGQTIGEIPTLATGVRHTFAHLGAFSLAFYILATRVLAGLVITSELLVLNTLWPRAESTMSSPDQRPTSLGAENGV
jgi:hypothetical protein